MMGALRTGAQAEGPGDGGVPLCQERRSVNTEKVGEWEGSCIQKPQSVDIRTLVQQKRKSPHYISEAGRTHGGEEAGPGNLRAKYVARACPRTKPTEDSRATGLTNKEKGLW